MWINLIPKELELLKLISVNPFPSSEIFMMKFGLVNGFISNLILPLLLSLSNAYLREFVTTSLTRSPKGIAVSIFNEILLSISILYYDYYL